LENAGNYAKVFTKRRKYARIKSVIIIDLR